jgi:hypothetical protein
MSVFVSMYVRKVSDREVLLTRSNKQLGYDSSGPTPASIHPYCT